MKASANKVDNCRSCGRSIFWVMDQNGVRFPVDSVRAAAYRFVGVDLDTNNTVVKLDEPYYISHFKTCPDASSWGKKGDRSP